MAKEMDARTPTIKEKKGFEQAVVDAVLDLDFSLRCYYLCLKDDKRMSEEDILKEMKRALEKGMAESNK